MPLKLVLFFFIASSGESVGEFCQDAAVLVFFSRRFASFSGTKQVNVGF